MPAAGRRRQRWPKKEEAEKVAGQRGSCGGLSLPTAVGRASLLLLRPGEDFLDAVVGAAAVGRGPRAAEVAGGGGGKEGGCW